jgi:hypothetical protein
MAKTLSNQLKFWIPICWITGDVAVLDSPPQNPWTIAGPIIAGCATLLAAGIAWAKDRNKAARRTQILDEATKYIAFWQAVKTAEESIADESQKKQIARSFEERLAAAKFLVNKKGTYAARSDRQQARKARWYSVAAILAIFILSLQTWMLLSRTVSPDQYPGLSRILSGSTFALLSAVVLGFVISELKSLISAFQTSGDKSDSPDED